MILLPLAGIAISFVLYRLVYDGAPEGIPRVGSTGGIGYLIAALRFAMKSHQVLDEADEMFGGRTYAMPTFSGWIIVLSRDHIETIRTSDDSVFNQPLHVYESLQFGHTLNLKQSETQYQATLPDIVLLLNKLSRRMSDFIPHMLDEATLAMEETFKPPSGSEYISLPVADIMTRMMARVHNRALLGTAMCRNEPFVRAVVNFSHGVGVHSRLLIWIPDFLGLRSLVYFVLSSIWGGSKHPKALLKPYLTSLKGHAESGDQSPTIARFLSNNAPPEWGEDVDDLAMTILKFNFGGIFTISTSLIQTLFEVAQMSIGDVDSMREEVMYALEQEGGWNKRALDRFWKIDSLLREVGRMHGMSLLALARVTIANGRLPDGVVIPSGYQVAVNLKHFHRDPHVYPNPHVFDPFRFSTLRENETEDTGSKDSNMKHGFTTVDNHYFNFGVGRHVCAGKSFASMELKIMIAVLLLNYEVKLPDGKLNRPKSLVLDAIVLPPLKEQLLFKPRLRKTKGGLVI
ncbi:cytochrome P450 family protein [Pleurotus pulmonarius]|nr:hypothetical protein EYR38_003475 [Pleurotus pulmonarius]